MTPDHIRTVQSTWTTLLPVKDIAAQILCEKLRQNAPSLVCLVRGDTRQRGMKLMQVIDVAVNGLGRPNRSAHLMRALGRRNADCAATIPHYDSIAVSLLGMLDTCLGTDFTPGVKVAWETVYLELAATMRKAAVGTLPGNALTVQERRLGSAS